MSSLPVALQSTCPILLMLVMLSCSVGSDGCGVAICFSGHLRGLELFPSMKQNTLSNLIEAISLGSPCQGNNVFGYVTLESEANRQRTIKLVMDTFNPVDLLVELDSGNYHQQNVSVSLPTPSEMAKHPGYLWQQDPMQAVHLARMQYIKISKSFAMVEKYEKNRKEGKFSWVVRARWDSAWYRKISPAVSFSDDRVWVKDTCVNGVDDKFALVPRPLADKFFNSSRWLFDSEQVNWWAPSLVWQPEAFLWMSMWKQEIPLGRATVPMVLMREKVSPDSGVVYPQPSCKQASAWDTLSTVLAILPLDRDLDKDKLMLGLKRMMMTMCLKSTFEQYGLVASEDMVFPDLTFTLTSWHPFENRLDITDISNELGLDPNYLVNNMWLKGLPIAPTNGEFETEVNFMLRSLRSIADSFQSRPNHTFVMQVNVPNHDDVDEAKLQPQSTQRFKFSSKQGLQITEGLTCLLLHLWKPFLLLSSTSLYDGLGDEECWNNLHSVEQSISRQLDYHALTRATWSGNVEGVGSITYVS